MTTKYDLMRHALGVQEYGAGQWSKPYRNRFVASDDDAMVWHGLVGEGLAVCTHKGGNSPLTDGMPSFIVTDAGRIAALDGIVFKRKWGRGTPTNR
jgi:hypothetical protein